MSQFGFCGSPTVQQLAVSSGSASPTPPPHSSTSTLPATSSSTTAVTSSAPVARPGSPPTTPGAPPPRCCETGRPIYTDPLTGQTVCSCQYDLLSYQRLASAGVGAAGIPALSMYSAPYADGMAAYFPALGADQAPFYTATAAGLELKENLASGAAWPYPSVYHPYDAAFAGYPFNGYGMDLNGARRKNATRETTSTLKAWLNEHKKNPYPTKGEKIMLAIITKMTLTQVSTWFANARRRLKKENKMTWEPRNRVEDEDNNNDDEGGRKSADNVKDPDSKDSGTASSEDGDRPPPPLDAASDCWSESRPDSGPDSPECLYERPHHLLHPAYHHLHHPSRLTAPSSASSPPPAGSSGGGNPKPRIWSLADMASKENDVHYQPVTTSAFYSAGKLVSPLASRGAALHPHHLHHSVHHPGAYARHDLYRFYGSAAAGHLAAAGGSGVGDVSLLETYSRTFGAGAFGVANSGVGGAGISPLSSVLSKAAAVAAAAAGGSPFPMNGGGAGSLGLTVSTSAGASSSSSTGSSVAEHLQSAGLHASVDSKLPPPSDGGKQLQLNKA